MNEQMNKRTTQHTNERPTDRTNEQTNKRTNEQTRKRTNGQTNECKRKSRFVNNRPKLRHQTSVVPYLTDNLETVHWFNLPLLVLYTTKCDCTWKLVCENNIQIMLLNIILNKTMNPLVLFSEFVPPDALLA